MTAYTSLHWTAGAPKAPRKSLRDQGTGWYWAKGPKEEFLLIPRRICLCTIYQETKELNSAQETLPFMQCTQLRADKHHSLQNLTFRVSKQSSKTVKYTMQGHSAVTGKTENKNLFFESQHNPFSLATLLLKIALMLTPFLNVYSLQGEFYL